MMNKMMNSTIYLAGSLFNESERNWNTAFKQSMDEISEVIEVILPQIFGSETSENKDYIFNQCLKGIEESEIVLVKIDCFEIDSGTAFECGYAYSLGKKIIGIVLDSRIRNPDYFNLMLNLAFTDVLFFNNEDDRIEDVAKEIGIVINFV